jgi:GntR family transcriptional regulator
MPALDAESPIPLYHQLADLLMAGIESGDYETGSRIPSEPELARSHGIGRPTVRQATELLIRKGCLERRRGSGTFVIEPPEEIDLLSLAGTLASFEEKGIAVETQLLQRPRRLPAPLETENPFAGRDAYFYSRLSCVDQSPVLLEEIHLDPDLFAGLGRVGLAGRSLSKVVAEHFGMRVEAADQNFRLVHLDEPRANLLGCESGDPILLVNRRLHFPNAESAVFAQLYCRTDRLTFSQRLVAPSPTGVQHA